MFFTFFVMNEYYLGIDIGGTKCAVVVGDNDFKIHHIIQFETCAERGYSEILDEFSGHIDNLLPKNSGKQLKRIGIS